MKPTVSSEEFWSEPAMVSAYSSESTDDALHYEEQLLQAAVDAATATGPVRLIEVLGAGGGREVPAVRRVAPNAAIRASDISLPMVEACRQRVDARSLAEVQVEHAGVSDLRPAPGGADVVVALGAVLGAATDEEVRDQLFHRLAQLLRSGGALGFVVQQRRGRPDWATYFAVRDLLARAHVGGGRPGDRLVGTSTSATLFHHFTPTELTTELVSAGFTVHRIVSLRRWARSRGQRTPLRSPNPLLVVATLTRPRP